MLQTSKHYSGWTHHLLADVFVDSASFNVFKLLTSSRGVLSKYDAVVQGAPLAVEAPVSETIKAPREDPAVNHLHPLKIMTLLMKRKMSLPS